MSDFLSSFIQFLFRLGIFGVFALSFLDSTFFVFMPPLIIDAALIFFISRNTVMMPFYAAFVTAGSMAGCTFDYLIIGKTSQKSLEKILPKKKFDYIKEKLKRNAFWALIVASLLPPPFPFSPFVWVAASINFSLKKSLAAIFIGRGIRFLLEGVLAILFGRQLLRILDSPIVKWFVLFILVVSIAGTIFSIFKWLKVFRK